MNIQKPVEAIEKDILNRQIEAQSRKWDIESDLQDFQRALDTLDLISDGLPDDPKVSNALNCLHGNLSEVYSNIKLKLLEQYQNGTSA